MLSEIFERCEKGAILEEQELKALLELTPGSPDCDRLLDIADRCSRKAFEGKGIIFAQIGLDNQPCRVNCKFCSLAKDAMKGKPCLIRSKEDTVQRVRELTQAGADDIFLMTTAEFDPEDFLEYCKAVRRVLPAATRLVANVGDFDLAYARRLKAAGVTGAYHICRLGEGRDTLVNVERRMQTLDAIRDGGLELYYCVEPIGPEHTNEELIREMTRTRDYPVGVMAVMKRTAVPGTLLEGRGEISSDRFAQICAVTTLAMRPKRAMGVHEPDACCLRAGANQIYAEYGTNPRDTKEETHGSRGYTVARARDLLSETGWK